MRFNNAAEFYEHIANFCKDPNFDWQKVMPEDIYRISQPTYSNYKTVQNTWGFGSYEMLFHIAVATYFNRKALYDNWGFIDTLMELKA